MRQIPEYRNKAAQPASRAKAQAPRPAVKKPPSPANAQAARGRSGVRAWAASSKIGEVRSSIAAPSASPTRASPSRAAPQATSTSHGHITRCCTTTGASTHGANHQAMPGGLESTSKARSVVPCQLIKMS
ncbi:MAG: hypothetical protein IPN01_07060 [Deltaproteobacteria bacterium]|nr:hypothetical protein [Deltaproteobacteria bacterium]